jgi:hypothetical protein
LARDLPALAHACFLDPTTAGTPARPGSRIPVMDLPKITDAHRLKALGIQLPKRIRVVRPQPSPKNHRQRQAPCRLVRPFRSGVHLARDLPALAHACFLDHRRASAQSSGHTTPKTNQSGQAPAQSQKGPNKNRQAPCRLVRPFRSGVHLARDLPALAHACFLDPTTEAARRLALLVASASVEVIRIPVMDLLKITDAHRLKALGIHQPLHTLAFLIPPLLELLLGLDLMHLMLGCGCLTALRKGRTRRQGAWRCWWPAQASR